MTSDVVLKVENLGKVFKMYTPSGRVKEWLTLGTRSYHKEYHALKNISFEVRRGGFLGIIGPNGAGKSTLLKVITGVLEPSSGSYKASGKVLSLLELGGGMDPDLSGRENVVRSAQLLGFPEGYVEEKMEQIAEFAELGDFFDKPLGIYSSGMRIRLAFSLFAFLECEILILDEVLAVGDIFFRQKCYVRLEELIKQNVAIILVTHSTGTVRQYCSDVIVMQNGEIAYHGSSDIAIQKYFELKKDKGIIVKASSTFVEEDYVAEDSVQPESKTNSLDWPPESAFDESNLPSKNQNKQAKLTHLLVCDDQGNPRQLFKQGETVCIYFAYQVRENIGVPIVGLSLYTTTNLFLHGRNSIQFDSVEHPQKIKAGDIIRYKRTLKLDVAPGNYIFNLGLSAMHPADFAMIKVLSKMEFKEKLIPVIGIKPAGTIQVVLDPERQVIGLHAGLCNLNGEMQFELINNG